MAAGNEYREWLKKKYTPVMNINVWRIRWIDYRAQLFRIIAIAGSINFPLDSIKMRAYACELFAVNSNKSTCFSRHREWYLDIEILQRESERERERIIKDIDIIFGSCPDWPQRHWDWYPVSQRHVSSYKIARNVQMCKYRALTKRSLDL